MTIFCIKLPWLIFDLGPINKLANCLTAAALAAAAL